MEDAEEEKPAIPETVEETSMSIEVDKTDSPAADEAEVDKTSEADGDGDQEKAEDEIEGGVANNENQIEVRDEDSTDGNNDREGMPEASVPDGETSTSSKKKISRGMKAIGGIFGKRGKKNSASEDEGKSDDEVENTQDAGDHEADSNGVETDTSPPDPASESDAVADSAEGTTDADAEDIVGDEETSTSPSNPVLESDVVAESEDGMPEADAEEVVRDEETSMSPPNPALVSDVVAESAEGTPDSDAEDVVGNEDKSTSSKKKKGGLKSFGGMFGNKGKKNKGANDEGKSDDERVVGVDEGEIEKAEIAVSEQTGVSQTEGGDIQGTPDGDGRAAGANDEASETAKDTSVSPKKKTTPLKAIGKMFGGKKKAKSPGDEDGKIDDEGGLSQDDGAEVDEVVDGVEKGADASTPSQSDDSEVVGTKNFDVVDQPDEPGTSHDAPDAEASEVDEPGEAGEDSSIQSKKKTGGIKSLGSMLGGKMMGKKKKEADDGVKSDDDVDLNTGSITDEKENDEKEKDEEVSSPPSIEDKTDAGTVEGAEAGNDRTDGVTDTEERNDANEETKSESGVVEEDPKKGKSKKSGGIKAIGKMLGGKRRAKKKGSSDDVKSDDETELVDDSQKAEESTSNHVDETAVDCMPVETGKAENGGEQIQTVPGDEPEGEFPTGDAATNEEQEASPIEEDSAVGVADNPDKPLDTEESPNRERAKSPPSSKSIEPPGSSDEIEPKTKDNGAEQSPGKGKKKKIKANKSDDSLKPAKKEGDDPNADSSKQSKSKKKKSKSDDGHFDPNESMASIDSADGDAGVKKKSKKKKKKKEGNADGGDAESVDLDVSMVSSHSIDTGEESADGEASATKKSKKKKKKKDGAAATDEDKKHINQDGGDDLNASMASMDSTDDAGEVKTKKAKKKKKKKEHVDADV